MLYRTYCTCRIYLLDTYFIKKKKAMLNHWRLLHHVETFLKIICIKVHTRNIFNHLSRIYFGHHIQRQFTMVIKYSEHFVVVMQYLEVLQLKTTVTVCS